MFTNEQQSNSNNDFQQQAMFQNQQKPTAPLGFVQTLNGQVEKPPMGFIPEEHQEMVEQEVQQETELQQQHSMDQYNQAIAQANATQ